MTDSLNIRGDLGTPDAGRILTSSLRSEPTLLDVGNLPTEKLAELALREGQCSIPIYRVHRWFARRLGSQFRSILAALSLPSDGRKKFWSTFRKDLNLQGKVVLDPFVGGGTALVEARRAGAQVIGFDIDPVATAITRFELEAGSFDIAHPEVVRIVQQVSKALAGYHTTTLADGTKHIVLHHFWVERKTCDGCNHEYDLHPHYQLAHDARQNKQWVVCAQCDAVHELAFSRKKFSCACGHETQIERGTYRDGNVKCPACNHEEVLARDNAPRPTYRLFAQEYLPNASSAAGRKFKAASDTDRRLVSKAERALAQFEQNHAVVGPTRLIPTKGRSSNRPLIFGIRTYRELFNPRQLLHLGLLADEIRNVKDAKVRQLLSLAFSEHLATNNMYVGYAFGYRRIAALFSFHGYRHIVRPVELNPWLDGPGRGTFQNVLAKIGRAIAYAKAPYTLDTRKASPKTPTAPTTALMGPVSLDAADVLSGGAPAAIVTASSARMVGLPDGSVDLIASDPPYFDNISYSELSDFYLAWHQYLGYATGMYRRKDRSAPIGESLAATSKSDLVKQEYKIRLTQIFCECVRVLKPTGTMIFTYHHKHPEAWEAVAHALVAAGLRCQSVIPLRGEGQGGLHTYDGTIKWDAVLVCRKDETRQSSQPRGLYVRAVDLKAYRRRVKSIASQLRKVPAIGFRVPDEVNLLRALLCASATAQSSPDCISLGEALKATRNQ